MSLELLSTAFVEIILDDQNLFAPAEHWKELLKLIPLSAVRDELEEEWGMYKDRTALDKWQDLRDIVQKYKNGKKEKEVVCLLYSESGTDIDKSMTHRLS